MSLEPRHYTMLHDESGIPEALITQRGYRTVTLARELTTVGYAKVQANQVPGILIPIYDVTGKPAMYLDDFAMTVFRPDVPRQSAR